MKLRQINALILANNLGWHVAGGGYKAYSEIRAAVKNETPVEALWLEWDSHKNDSKNNYWPKPDIQKENTYDECVGWLYDAEKQIIEITIWEGDWDGRRERKRAKWKYAVRDDLPDLVQLIQARTEMALWNHAEHKEAEYQEEQHRLRVQARVDQFLKETS